MKFDGLHDGFAGPFAVHFQRDRGQILAGQRKGRHLHPKEFVRFHATVHVRVTGKRLDRQRTDTQQPGSAKNQMAKHSADALRSFWQFDGRMLGHGPIRATDDDLVQNPPIAAVGDLARDLGLATGDESIDQVIVSVASDLAFGTQLHWGVRGDRVGDAENEGSDRKKGKRKTHDNVK